MAIIYPRPFLAGTRFLTSQMALQRQTAQNTLGNGGLQAMELGDAMWSFQAVTAPMRWSGRRAWAAWHSSLGGGLKRILAYDWVGSYPIAYGVDVLGLTKATGGAFSGQASLSAYTATTVQLVGLPAAYKATAGDRLSFPWAGVRAYHEVVEDAVASGAGVIDLTVEPPIRTNPATPQGAVVDLVRPACVMVIKPGTFDAPESGALASVSFEAVQVVR